MATKLQKIVEASGKLGGWMTDEERELLATTALDRAKGLGEEQWVNWVELGSYHGKSTVLLAWALKEAKAKGMVYAVDPHTGELSYPRQFDKNGRMVAGENTFEAPSFDIFMENLAALKVEGYVEAVVSRATDVEWNTAINLLLVDSLHDYTSVKADYEHYRPFLEHNALVIFHDYSDWQGVNDLVNEKLDDGDFEQLAAAGSLIVMRFIGAQ